MRRRMMMNGGLKSVITINQTIDDPYSRVSGDVNGSAIRWIRENSHRYLGKYKDGVMYICQLDDANSNYYHDGTAAVLTGAEGDVFMRMPNFYYCGTEGNIVDITFSTDPFDNCVPWRDSALIGVYKAYIRNNKAYSMSSVYLTGNLTQPSFKNCSINRGVGFQIIDTQMHNVLAFLYVAMYGNTDVRRTVGFGNTNEGAVLGTTDNLGMKDSSYESGYTGSRNINYWGLEAWYGTSYEFLHDFYLPGNSSNAQMYDPVTNGTRLLEVFDYGYHSVKMYKIGRYLDTFPMVNDPKKDSQNTGYCVRQKNVSSSSRHISLRAGIIPSFENIFNFATDNTESLQQGYIGSRLAFRGNIVEIDNVQEFKNIVATN